MPERFRSSWARSKIPSRLLDILIAIRAGLLVSFWRIAKSAVPNLPKGILKELSMAARGYLDAFQLVKEDAGQAYSAKDLNPEFAAQLFSDRHQAWFQKLLEPSVNAGILERRDLVGYRRHMVFLRGSLHTPPHFDSVRDGMEALCECLLEEPDAFVRAVLGHWLFGFVHPYMDGNGRIARFIMNLMLASGGYPWTVIHVEDRASYIAALEKASMKDNPGTFAAFVAN